MEYGLYASISNIEIQGKIDGIFGDFGGTLAIDRENYRAFVEMFFENMGEYEISNFFKSIGFNNSEIKNLFENCYLQHISAMKISLTAYPKILKQILEIKDDILFTRDVLVKKVTHGESLLYFMYFDHSQSTGIPIG